MSALTKIGNRERGKAVFTKSCSACHKLGDVGQGLAPDLAALSDKSPEYLLLNILDPNRGVEARYLSYTATLKDGTQRVGFLQAETATSLTLVGPDGKPHSVLRTDIDELRSSGKSVMPEGIEKEISIDQMADLLAFLRSVAPAFQPAAVFKPAHSLIGGGLADAGWKAGATRGPKRKEFPGNVPQVLQPNPDGSVRLPAVACEIYGTSLVFESKYNNLGFWGNENDHAVWTINLPKGGKFDVTLDYACNPDTAGNAFVITVGEKKLIGRAESTGSWDTYKQTKIGSITLKEGEQKIVLRSNRAIRGYLMDLRGLRLTPGKE